MKNLYNVTKGQLMVIWIFGILAWLIIFFYALDSFTPPSSMKVVLWLLIPFALAFYTIGWRNYRKSNS